MNIEKEKELFEIEFSKIKSDISFWVNTWDEDMQGYNHPVMCWIWHIWLASANRYGYKFVPVEPTEAMLEASLCRQWDDLSSPLENMDVLKYKAMIGAAE